MKQPDSMDIGTRMDVVKHRLQVAKEDLDTAHLTFDAGQFRGANNRAYYSIFHTISAVLAKEGVAFMFSYFSVFRYLHIHFEILFQNSFDSL